MQRVTVAGDPAIVPELEEQLPKHLADLLVDAMRFDAKAPEREIFEATLNPIREKDGLLAGLEGVGALLRWR